MSLISIAWKSDTDRSSQGVRNPLRANGPKAKLETEVAFVKGGSGRREEGACVSLVGG